MCVCCLNAKKKKKNGGKDHLNSIGNEAKFWPLRTLKRIPEKPPINAHADESSGTIGINFGT